MKRKILYISMCMPFDNAFHAGGKTFNYYINSFANDDNNEVTLITKVLPEEEKYIHTINPKINALFVATSKNKIRKYVNYFKSLNSKVNPLYPYGNVLTKDIFNQIENKLKYLKSINYCPDVIILEWTWMLLFIDKVKSYFPDARYVASEHDVSFLGLKRRADNSKFFLQRLKNKLYYKNIKNKELSSIEKCDFVVTHNEKDKKLLINNGIARDKVGVITPYFEKQELIERKSNHRDIVFYGAMNRIENSGAALWFINNVLPKLSNIDIRFVIVGNKPPEKLLRLQNDRIICTGFVEKIQPFFSEAMCVVAPLQEGAGIKVKILEAMSMGAPVLTNDIGIEGIDAIDGEHFLYCREAEDYVKIIENIYYGRIDADVIGRNAVEMMKEKYNLNRSFKKYSDRVYSLIK